MSIKRIAEGPIIGMENPEIAPVKKARFTYAPIECLPLDLLKKIFFEHVPLADLKSIPRVCKEYHDLVNNSEMKHIVDRFFANKLVYAALWPGYSKMNPAFLYEKIAHLQIRALQEIPFILEDQHTDLRLEFNTIKDVSNLSFIDIKKILVELPLTLMHAHFETIFLTFKDVYLLQSMHLIQLLPCVYRSERIALNELQMKIQELRWSLIPEKGKDVQTQWKEIRNSLGMALKGGMLYLKEILNKYGEEKGSEQELPFIEQTFERFIDGVKLIDQAASEPWLRQTTSYANALQDVRALCKDIAPMLTSLKNKIVQNLSQAQWYCASLNMMQGNGMFKNDFVSLYLNSFYQHNRYCFFINKDLVVTKQPNAMQTMGERIQPIVAVWLKVTKRIQVKVDVSLIDSSNRIVPYGVTKDGDITITDGQIRLNFVKLNNILTHQESYRLRITVGMFVVETAPFRVTKPHS